MQTLFIPDKIQIDFLDAENNPLRQGNILIGISIFANRKNDIDLSPFLTDQNGAIRIISQDIKNNFDNFISYGLMDYSSIESAKSEIEIYFWGKKSLDRYINYWTRILENKDDLKQFEKWGTKLGKREIESAKIERKEREELKIFQTCFNRTTKISDDIIIVKDIWDRENDIVEYNVKLENK